MPDDYREMYLELLEKFDNMVPKKLYQELRQEVKKTHEKNKKLNVENTRLKDDAKRTGFHAAVLEMQLHLRSKMEEFEENLILTTGINPTDTQKYQEFLETKFPGEKNHKEAITKCRRYRAWILILYLGDENTSAHLKRLRLRLVKKNGKDRRTNYHEYAFAMHRVYNLISKNIHGKSLRLDYANVKKIPQYFNAIGPELLDNINVFIESDLALLGKNTNQKSQQVDAATNAGKKRHRK